MKIQVQLYYGIRKFTCMAEDRFELQLDPESRVGDLKEAIRLSTTENVVVILNDRLAGNEVGLSDGDRISLFPAPSGG